MCGITPFGRHTNRAGTAGADLKARSRRAVDPGADGARSAWELEGGRCGNLPTVIQ